MNQKFSEHAMEILGNPRYKNWREIEKGKPGSGIMTIGPDPEGVIRKCKIIPSDNYPETPPIVYAEPEFKKDPFNWKNGTLTFVNKFWTELIQNTENPLDVLLKNLYEKYNIGI